MSARIACCQFAPDVESPARSAELAREAIAAAVGEGAQIVVLPELCTSGYVFRSADEARAAATPADGELLQSWAAEAARGDALVIGGFCELASDGRLFNSAVLSWPTASSKTPSTSARGSATMHSPTAGRRNTFTP
jgi:predicted amidohydrolase